METYDDLTFITNDKRKPRDTAYFIREPFSIVVPGQSRYVIALKGHKMFHCDEDLNATEDCSRFDEAGICTGHTMGKQEFLNKFCNGVMPKELKVEKG